MNNSKQNSRFDVGTQSSKRTKVHSAHFKSARYVYGKGYKSGICCYLCCTFHLWYVAGSSLPLDDGAFFSTLSYRTRKLWQFEEIHGTHQTHLQRAASLASGAAAR